MTNRDIIVAGASAGGVEALSALIGELPKDLTASVFVVLHLVADLKSNLPAILGRCTQLPVSHPADGEPFQPGSIYIAPPDFHMLVGDGVIQLDHGPRENRSRPAIDPLFRSAAGVYGRRVIGVLLTGLLDDGTAGMIAVTKNGGIGIVQDPKDATYGDMPRSAVENEHPQYILPLKEIGAKLAELTRDQVDTGEADMSRGDISNADEVVRRQIEEEQEGRQNGQPLGIACPECGGVIYQISEGDYLRFRCRVGHTYSPESMLAAQSDSVESALWAAVRILEEQASLYRRMANRHQKAHRNALVRRFEDRAKEVGGQANLIRQAILEKSFVPPEQ